MRRGGHSDFLKKALFGIIMVGSLWGSQAGIAHANQIYDLASTTTWTYQIRGEASAHLGSGVIYQDINNDGEKDLIVTELEAGHNGRASSGSTFILYSTLLDTFASGSIISLASSTNYNIRIDGAAAGDRAYLGLPNQYDATVADVFNTGKADLVIGPYQAGNNNRSASGSVYILANSLLASLTGTGNLIDLASSSHYTLRLDGALADDWFGTSIQIGDIDNDDKNDLLIGAGFASNGGHGNSGSAYVLYNSLFGNLTGTGHTLDMASSSHFSIRYDGPVDSALVGLYRMRVADIDGNGRADIFLNGFDADNSAHPGFAGSVYIIPDDLISSYDGGGGNIVNLASSTSYRVRYDGPDNNATIGISVINPIDINADGEKDLMISAGFATSNSRTHAGSLFILSHALVNSYGTSTGNRVDLASTTSFNVRIDGALADDYLADGVNDAADFNNDGALDLLIDARGASPNGRSQAGSIYIVYNHHFGSLTGTGNTLDIADSANWDIRYDGAQADDDIGDVMLQSLDWNRDGANDLIIGANHGSDGYLYVILNFPHILYGSVDASESVTAIADVQYQADTANPLGAWTSCIAADASFNSVQEDFICTLSGLSSGTHTVYVRAVDVNGVFSPVTSYLHKTVTLM